MNNDQVIIGIDIGGTNTVYGFIDKAGKIILSNSIPTLPEKSADNLIKRIADSLIKDINRSGKKIKGIGIGAPNANYYRGTVEHPPNLNWEVVEFVKLMKAYFPVPIAITNDANAAAIGEMKYGAAKEMKDFILITLGTGVGSGIVVNGDLVYGYDGFAGELGHSMVIENGRKCGCGKYGCLEAYTSASGLCRTAQIFLAEEMETSILSKYNNEELSSKIIAKAAEKNDIIAKKVFDYSGKILGMKLADVVSVISPEAIFLFGGVVNAGKLIFEPTKKYLEEYMPRIHRGHIKLLPSGLQGQNIAVMGAGALIVHEMEKTKNI